MTVVDDTALELVRGDSEDFLITVSDEEGELVDLSKAVDGTAARPAILRFAVKEDGEDSNSEALVYKDSYHSDEIVVLPQSGDTLAMARVLVDKPDTESDDLGTRRWDLEVTRQDFVRTSAGTASVTADGTTVTGVGTLFTRAKVGDVFQPLGVNIKPVKITAIASATSMTVESGAVFTTAAGEAFEIRRGKSRTAARGPIALVEGIVTG